MAYIYQADIYCDECGEKIKEYLRGIDEVPSDPDDESSYDSDEYPKWGRDDEECDCPQHCGSHEHCENAIELSDGSQVGCLIGNNLTSYGVEYVKQAVAEGGMVAREVWATEFDWVDLPATDDDLDGEGSDDE